jgi:5-methylcytosine-specific restriction endonuclease McrA
MSTLVLNADMQPLSIVPLSVDTWQDAITKVWSGDVVVVDEYPDQDKHSPSITIKLPSVVMVKEFQSPKRTVKFSRYNVFLRDMFTCQYCGLDMSDNVRALTLDHYHPKAKGGKTIWSNSVAACPRCNHEKAHHNEMEPRQVPYKPDYWELVKKRKMLPITIADASWIPYLGWADESLITIRPFF